MKMELVSSSAETTSAILQLGINVISDVLAFIHVIAVGTNSSVQVLTVWGLVVRKRQPFYSHHESSSIFL